MGRPKGKKDSKPRKKKFENPEPKKVESAPTPYADEYIPEAETKTEDPKINKEAEDEAARVEVDMLLTAIFAGVASFTRNPNDALSPDERATAPGMVAPYYSRVIRPKIQSVDAIAAGIAIASLCASRMPSVMRRLAEMKAQKPIYTQATPVYPKPEPAAPAPEVTQ